jgi:hypothetical protein
MLQLDLDHTNPMDEAYHEGQYHGRHTSSNHDTYTLDPKVSQLNIRCSRRRYKPTQKQENDQYDNQAMIS